MSTNTYRHGLIQIRIVSSAQLCVSYFYYLDAYTAVLVVWIKAEREPSNFVIILILKFSKNRGHKKYRALVLWS